MVLLVIKVQRLLHTRKIESHLTHHPLHTICSNLLSFFHSFIYCICDSFFEFLFILFSFYLLNSEINNFGRLKDFDKKIKYKYDYFLLWNDIIILIMITSEYIATATLCSNTGWAIHSPTIVQRNTSEIMYVLYRHW